MSVTDRGRPPKTNYISLAEASRLFAAAGLPSSTRTIERMMDADLLPYRRTPGGTRRLYRTGVERYLREYLDNC